MMSLAITGISSIVADPGRPGVIYIATLGHGVWKYESMMTGVDGPDDSASPEEFVLEQNYPNPFLSGAKSAALGGGNPATTIRFEIPPALGHSKVQLAIFDLHGELVRAARSPVACRQLFCAVEWQNYDNRVASGVYLCRLQVGNVFKMRKLSLLK
jgi:hypothetical protein